MKNIMMIICISLFYFMASAQDLGYKPSDVEVYQLSNGFTVILSEDHNTPQVFGGVIVRAGSKDDPKDATGVAHYQEHMLFKGTEELGSTNWEAEKPYIDNIFNLYDELAKTSDAAERTRIQNQINQESVKANEYAIPNEMSNLIKSMGGTSLNAGTGPDYTLYYNAFPPSQIEKWIDLYSHRFEKPVFRSFQAELEVVYEEKNMKSDNFIFPMFESFNKNFFRQHPYGQQTAIGTVENLKNPSLSKMYDFFKTWYVPNNMALILVGDFDSRLVKPMIESAYGKWERKDLPVRPVYEEQPFKGRESVEVKMSPIKIALLGFRTVPAGHPDEIALNICNSILSNQSQTGLLDKLVIENKLMAAQIISMPYNDQGECLFVIVPKIIGQKLSSGESLVMAELSKLKSGDFDSVQVENIKTELYRNYQLNMESNQFKANKFASAFGRYQTIEDLLKYPDQLMSVTKADVMSVARKYYGDNYLAFYSKMGFPKKEKIEKPGYKPLVVNKSAVSLYAEKFSSIPETKEKPEYIDFTKDVKHISVSDGMQLYCVKNPANSVFTLKMKFKIGHKNLPELKYAVDAMSFASPEGMTLNDFLARIANNGSTYTISGDESYTIVEITGFDRNFEDVIPLIGSLLNKPSLEQSKVDVIYEGEKAGRKMERSEPDEVANALVSYVKYSNNSEYLDRLSLSGIKSLQATHLAEVFRSISDYGVEIHYAGNLDPEIVSECCKKNIHVTGKKSVLTPVVLDLNQYNENTVFIVDMKKATQSKVFFLVNGSAYDPSYQADLDAFNLYFGGGFSGLVLQEIREYRSMAYTAGANFASPALKGKEMYFRGYIGTQADKTTDAIQVFDTLVRHMPVKEERTEMIKKYLMLSSVSERPHFRNLSEQMIKWQNQGYEIDPVQYNREAYENLIFEDILKFYNNNLASKPVVICIVGDKSKIDLSKLNRFGKLVFVKQSSLFSK